MSRITLNAPQTGREQPEHNHDNDLICRVEAEQRAMESEKYGDCNEYPSNSNLEMESGGEAETGEIEAADTNSPFRFREGGWGWVCVVSYFVMNSLTCGLVNAYSLISIELQTRYAISAQVAGWVYSINMICYMFSGPLCTALCNRFSCRRVAIFSTFTLSIGVLSLGYAPNIFVVFLGYSVLGGTSNGMHNLISILIIGQYFNERRGKATGLAHSGKSIGQLVYAPLFSFLLVHYGYQGAMLLITGLTLQLFVGGALLRSPRRKRGRNNHMTSDPTVQEELVVESAITVPASPNVNKEKQGEKINIVSTETTTEGSTIAKESRLKGQWLTTNLRRMLEKINSLIELSLLKDPVFLVYGGLLFCVNSTTNSFYNASLAGIIKDKDFSRNQVALLMALSGGLGCLAMLAGGFVIDLRLLRPYRVHLGMIMYLIPTVVMILIPVTYNNGWLFVLWLSFAMGAAFFSSQSTVIMVDVVGVRRHPSAVGLSMPFRGLGILLGAPLGGYLRDITESYSASLYVIGAVNLIAIFVVELVFLINKRKLDKIRKENFVS